MVPASPLGFRLPGAARSGTVDGANLHVTPGLEICCKRVYSLLCRDGWEAMPGSAGEVVGVEPAPTPAGTPKRGDSATRSGRTRPSHRELLPKVVTANGQSCDEG